MRAIYATTPIENWAYAAKLLSRDDFEPAYWVCTGSLKETVIESFPDTVVHDSIDCIQGRFPDQYDDVGRFSYPLDEQLLREFLDTESQALKMMDRLDTGAVTGAHFTHPQRLRHYHRMLMYWQMVLDDIEPDIAIFGSSPHTVSDYLLYSVCKHYDIETLIFTPTSLPETFYVREGMHQLPDGLETINPEVDLSETTIEYLDRLSGTYSDAEPDYMQSERSANRYEYIAQRLAQPAKYGHYARVLLQKLRKRLGKLTNLRERKPKAYVKTKGERIEDSHMTRYGWRAYRLRAKLYRHRLRKRYHELAIVPDLSELYIYVPLHYQPERTTSPEAGLFVHQYLIVNLLSHEAASNATIYVKEHPSQFSPRLKGEQGRESGYYEDLAATPRVELVPTDSPQFDLIDNAIAVATATGTAGWEAVVRGTPSLVFGAAWYRSCPGCYPVDSRSDVADALDEILSGVTVSGTEVRSFAGTVEQTGYRGKMLQDVNESESDQNAEVLRKAVVENV